MELLQHRGQEDRKAVVRDSPDEKEREEKRAGEHPGRAVLLGHDPFSSGAAADIRPTGLARAFAARIVAHHTHACKGVAAPQDHSKESVGVR